MRSQPISMFILAWVELAQSACAIACLGFWQPNWRCHLLFSCDWFARLGNWEAGDAT